MDAARTPVVVGVGQVNDRNPDPEAALDSVGLMEAALRAADADAGGGWLRDLDALSVVDQVSFPQLNPVAERLAARLGATPRIAEQTATASGDSPILLLNQAANRIGAGEIAIAAVVGGEAVRTAARRAALARGTDEAGQNIVRERSAAIAPGVRQRYRLAAPVDVYPLYENACRAAWGQSLQEAQQESAEIWARMSQVAAANPDAWLNRAMDAQAILTPSADNRPIAFPYTKFMVANASVNQGAGFIVTSLAEAQKRGVPRERLVYVGLGAAAFEPEEPLDRDRFDASPALDVSLAGALELNGASVAELDHVELYSCFPCIPKMARRQLGWPLEKPATVFGGLTFGGGPVGNYMSHAVVSMVQALRRQGALGLLFANGGYASHYHSILLGVRPFPGAVFPQAYDLQARADALRAPAPRFDEAYEGPVQIETYTVSFDRAGAPGMATIVARTPQGGRTVALTPADDDATIRFLIDGRREPVGAAGRIFKADDADEARRFTMGESPAAAGRR
jgi:acetyl-CoA C-acetyltransferase